MKKSARATFKPMQQLSSLSEERSGENTRDDKPAVSKSAPPTQKHEHGHHRITSFDTSIIGSMTNKEIHAHNKMELSFLSSLTPQYQSEKSNLTTQTRKTKVAKPEDVESVEKATAIRVHHIVKIFTPGDDGEDVIELTPEQVQRIKLMHESIESSVNFSFNYNTLLLVASVLAGLGLVSNSSTIIIASMLVSPLMGPVIGLAYSCVIWDKKLVKKSLRNEILSIAFCILMGMVICALTGWTALADDWPTEEMASRGDLHNFYISLPVAFFSGLGVAVSVLDQQVSSLVGVAISASLLPPAVDAGILWIAYAFTKHGILQPTPYPAETPTELEQEEEYDRASYRKMGAIALGVTLANIVLIWIASMIMFRMKEVLPIEKNEFWTDLKYTRRIYQQRALLQVVEVEEPALVPSQQLDTMAETNEEEEDDGNGN